MDMNLENKYKNKINELEKKLDLLKSLNRDYLFSLNYLKTELDILKTTNKENLYVKS